MTFPYNISRRYPSGHTIDCVQKVISRRLRLYDPVPRHQYRRLHHFSSRLISEYKSIAMMQSRIMLISSQSILNT